MVSPNEMPQSRTPRSSPPTDSPIGASFQSRYPRDPDSKIEREYRYRQIIVTADLADTVYNRDGINVAAVLIEEGCQLIEQAGLADPWYQKNMLATGPAQELLVDSVLLLQRYQKLLHTWEQG